MQEKINKRKFLTGTVVSNKMDKTCVVQVKWTAKHKKYNKMIRGAAKYKAHDKDNKVLIGDIVKIMETRPLSKEKRWTVKEILVKTKK